MADVASDPSPAGPVPGSWRVRSAGEVAAAWDRLATGLQPIVDAGDAVLLGVLLGALPTLAALAARLRGDFLLETCRVTRYRGGVTGGEPAWLCRPGLPLAGRRVIVVDDIHDDGTTLAAVAGWCRSGGAREVHTAVLVQRERLPGAPRADFTGLTVGAGYLYGCGMDIGGRFRHLPELYSLPPA